MIDMPLEGDSLLLMPLKRNCLIYGYTVSKAIKCQDAGRLVLEDFRKSLKKYSQNVASFLVCIVAVFLINNGQTLTVTI